MQYKIIRIYFNFDTNWKIIINTHQKWIATAKILMKGKHEVNYIITLAVEALGFLASKSILYKQHTHQTRSKPLPNQPSGIYTSIATADGAPIVRLTRDPGGPLWRGRRHEAPGGTTVKSGPGRHVETDQKRTDRRRLEFLLRFCAVIKAIKMVWYGRIHPIITYLWNSRLRNYILGVAVNIKVVTWKW